MKKFRSLVVFDQSKMLHSIETSQDDNWNISGSDDECDLPHKFKNPSKYETGKK